MWEAKIWAVIILVFVSSDNDLIALRTMYLVIKILLLKGKSRLKASPTDKKALGDQIKVHPGSQCSLYNTRDSDLNKTRP